MKYFKFIYPYYALIAANSEKTALKIYSQEVADIDEGVKFEQTNLDDFDDANDMDKTALVSYFISQNPNLISELLKEYANSEGILLIDSDLT